MSVEKCATYPKCLLDLPKQMNMTAKYEDVDFILVSDRSGLLRMFYKSPEWVEWKESGPWGELVTFQEVVNQADWKKREHTPTFEEAIGLLKGTDEDQMILSGMAGRDENWEIDEFDNSDFIGIMKSYWRVYPKDFSWDKFNSDPDEFAKWEEWLVDRGFNYLYIDFKFKEAALKGHCVGWNGVANLIIK